jgi:hypothetical protein
MRVAVSDNNMNSLIRSAVIRKRDQRIGRFREAHDAPEPPPEPVDLGAGARASSASPRNTNAAMNRWLRAEHHRSPLAEHTVEGRSKP